MQSSDRTSLWAIHSDLKRRKSPNGINLVFVPGQNVVLELNEVAGDVMEAFSAGPMNYDALCSALRNQYEIEDEQGFQQELDQVLERFAAQKVIVPLRSEGTDADTDSLR